MREEEEEDGEEEACDSNEIPFTAASDLSVSPNGGIEREGGHALPRLDCEIVTIRETERQIADSLPLTPSTNAERTATSAKLEIARPSKRIASILLTIPQSISPHNFR